MSHSVLKLWRSASARNRPQAPRRRNLGLRLEQLEDRLVPSTFYAATVSDLIADIKASNTAGGANTINLTAPTNAPYILAAVDNTTDGATGLPVIAAKDNLIIVGNGDTVARSTATGTPAFRLFDVASRASLTLQNLTVQGGLAFGSGVSAEGGAIYNQGTLDMSGATVQNNIAQGNNAGSGRGAAAGQNAAGGGIYSSGSLMLEGGTLIQNNQALGGQGSRNPAGAGGNGLGGGLDVSSGSVSLANATVSSNTAQGGVGGNFVLGGVIRGPSGAGGNGLGGGLYVSSVSVSLTGVTVSSNTAQGGLGGYGYGNAIPLCHMCGGSSIGAGGDGFGGGLYAAGGSVTLQSDTVTGNAANGGRGGSAGLGEGGGLCIGTTATVYLDAFTLANTANNTASTSNNDIFGSYILIR